MPRSQHLCIPNRNRLEFVVIPVRPRQARPGSFIKGYSKLRLRYRVDDCLVDVFDRLDEMGLSQDDVRIRGDVQRDGF